MSEYNKFNPEDNSTSKLVVRKLDLSPEDIEQIQTNRRIALSNEGGKILEYNLSAETLKTAYEKALLEIKDNEIKEADFVNEYGDVKENLEYVAKRKKQFEISSRGEVQEFQKLGKILEAIIDEYGEVWLGGLSKIHHTSEFDDIANGIDSVLEFKNEDSIDAEKKPKFVGLMLDATTGVRAGEKINKFKEDLEQGHLGRVKYFRAGENKVGLNNIPKVVIGCGHNTTKHLADLWVADNKVAIQNHPVKFLFFKQILFSLESAAKICEALPGKTQQQNAGIYRNYLEFLKPIFEKLDTENTIDKALEADPLWQNVQSQINSLKKYHGVKE